MTPELSTENLPRIPRTTAAEVRWRIDSKLAAAQPILEEFVHDSRTSAWLDRKLPTNGPTWLSNAMAGTKRSGFEPKRPESRKVELEDKAVLAMMKDWVRLKDIAGKLGCNSWQLSAWTRKKSVQAKLEMKRGRRCCHWRAKV